MHIPCINNTSSVIHAPSMHHYFIIYQPCIIHTPWITHVAYTHHPIIHHICIIHHSYISHTSCVIYASPVTHASSTHHKAFMHHSRIISTSYMHHPPCITMNHHWSSSIILDHHNRLCRSSPHGLVHNAITILYEGTTVLAHDTNAAHTHRTHKRARWR